MLSEVEDSGWWATAVTAEWRCGLKPTYELTQRTSLNLDFGGERKSWGAKISWKVWQTL